MGLLIDTLFIALAWCVHPVAGLIVAAVAIYGRLRPNY